MTQQEKQFVPKELAILLIEIGFNEPVLSKDTTFVHVKDNDEYEFATGILWQQAFDWFREIHKIYISSQNEEHFTTFKLITPNMEILSFSRHSTDHYEIARRECIEKLITKIAPSVLGDKFEKAKHKLKQKNGYLYRLKPFDGYKYRAKFVAENIIGTQVINTDVYTTNIDRKDVEKLLISSLHKKRNDINFKQTRIVHWASKEQDELTGELLDEVLKDI